MENTIKSWQELHSLDFSDPINLLPLLMLFAVILFLVALFSDQPPD
ncbi:hypothetical protein [Nitratifractor sp.]